MGRTADRCVGICENRENWVRMIWAEIVWLIGNFVIGMAIGGDVLTGVRYLAFGFLCNLLLIPFLNLWVLWYAWNTEGLFAYKYLLNLVGLEIGSIWNLIVFWGMFAVGIIILGIVVIIIVSAATMNES